MPKRIISSVTTFTISTLAYTRFLTDLRRDMAQSVKTVEELLERQKVLSYWSIGRKINHYLTANEQPRGAIGIFYARLSRDLQVNGRTLQQCEQFFRYFPQWKWDKDLKWSHYRFLLTEPDAAKRERWIARIKKDRIPTDELHLALLPAMAKKDEASVNLKEPVRGRLYTYRLLRAEDIEHFDVPWFIDLGFAARKEAPDARGELNNKNLYISEKIEESYRLKIAADTHADQLFTFRAKLRRVIDGDTLLVVIDQGFSYWNEQRLRLNAIDAPELDTLPGERARKWLQDELKGSPDIVVKTYKSDQWDRYLVDVFYIEKETDMHRVAAKGVWLNGRMVEEGLARLWKRPHQ